MITDDAYTNTIEQNNLIEDSQEINYFERLQTSSIHIEEPIEDMNTDDVIDHHNIIEDPIEVMNIEQPEEDSIKITPPPEHSISDTPISIDSSTKKALLKLRKMRKYRNISSRNSTSPLLSGTENLESTNIHVNETNITRNLITNFDNLAESMIEPFIEATEEVLDLHPKNTKNKSKKKVECNGCQKTFIVIARHKCKMLNNIKS